MRALLLSALLLSVGLPAGWGCAVVTEQAPFAEWSGELGDDDDTTADDDDDTGPDDDDVVVEPCDVDWLVTQKEEVSFSFDLAPLFEQTCQPCHTLQRRSGLELNAGTAWENLVDVPNSRGWGDLDRVEPGDAQASYAFHKLLGCDPNHPEWGYFDGAMPPPFPGVEPLTDEQTLLVYSWIQQGALDN